MKYVEFNIETNKIEFLNSVFGFESILLNGKQISKKFSFSGITHNINLNSQNLTLESQYKQFGKREIKLELKENGKLIETKIVEADKKQRIYWIAIGIFIGLLGFKLGQFLIQSVSG
ncbi:hypothetical protein ACFFU1_11570 [Algibacter miyuki]|uniref:Uncharacterized protein n=1 Tax=Algibacter miyuki TaxID=1306933 RepID=A0ABV5H0W3_9FLAO|nr:hypothetical protein [Algibacter miyuki]MDN3664393.1 hypothetical protein [Algibacter miyuki]